MNARAFIVVVLACVACSSPKVGPFTPYRAQPCGAEPDCPKHFTCKFPRVDSTAVCMPGENKLDSLPPLQ